MWAETGPAGEGLLEGRPRAETAGKAGSRGSWSAWQLGLAPWLLVKLSFCAEFGVGGGTLPMRRSKRRWQRGAAGAEKEREGLLSLSLGGDARAG